MSHQTPGAEHSIQVSQSFPEAFLFKKHVYGIDLFFFGFLNL